MYQVPGTAGFYVFPLNLVKIHGKCDRQYITRGFSRPLNKNIMTEKVYDAPGAQGVRFLRLLLEFSEHL